jgi:putative endonuclease
MKAVFEYGSIEAQAMAVEWFIKKQKSRKLLEQLIDPDFVPIAARAKLVRVPHVRD